MHVDSKSKPKEVRLKKLKFHKRQREAFASIATEILFGGASEGGKSAWLRRCLIRWCLLIPNLQCCLIRKKIGDLLLNHVEGPDGFRVLLEPLLGAKLVKITEDGVRFFNGSYIAFRHAQDERQFSSAQGVEFHVVCIDEATQLSERLIKAFRAWCRMSEEMQASLPPQFKGQFPKILYTANPIGPSLGYFRRNFVKARPAWEKEEVDGFLRQFIPSKIDDNPSANKKAQAGRLSVFDAATAKALIEGDWDAPLGDFFPEWDESRHVIPDAVVPDHWFRFRTFDWGSADPFACLWWAVSPGETLSGYDGKGNVKTTYIPRGALVAYREWYGCSDDDPAVGRRMRNEDIAAGIESRTEVKFKKQVTLTDSFPFADRGGPTIAEVFSKNGCVLSLGDTSRVQGWSQVRGRLIGAHLYEQENKRYPLIYFMESCRYSRDYLPALPRHPAESKREDAAEHGEATHICDIIRLACTAHTVIKEAPATTQDKIKAAVKKKMTVQSIVKQRGHGYLN